MSGPLEIQVVMSKPTKVVTSSTPPRRAGTLLIAIFVISGSATTSPTVKISTAMTKAGAVMVISLRTAVATIRPMALASWWIPTRMSILIMAESYGSAGSTCHPLERRQSLRRGSGRSSSGSAQATVNRCWPGTGCPGLVRGGRPPRTRPGHPVPGQHRFTVACAEPLLDLPEPRLRLCRRSKGWQVEPALPYDSAIIKMLIRVGIHQLANAIGLIVATAVLGEMTITGPAFVMAVLIFTVVEVVADPFMTKIAIRSVPALRSGVELVTTFVGLLITKWISSGLQITGVKTWVLATLIVWLAALVAALILPALLVGKAVDQRRG